MKKIVLWILILLTALTLLVACKEEPEIIEEPDKIGICLPEGSTYSYEGLSNTLQQAGYEVTVHNQSESQAKQISLVKELTEKGYKLLVVEPYIDTALTELLAAPQEAGIPVLVVNYRHQIPENLENVCFFIDTPTDLGTLQAAQLAKLPDSGDINGDGVVNYMIITGSTTDPDTKLQLDGITGSLPDQPPRAVKYTDNTRDSAYETGCAVLREYGRDVEVVITGGAEVSVGVTEAILDSGRYPNYDIYIIASGDSEALAEHFRSGNLFSYVASDSTTYNDKVSEVVKAMLEGKEFDRVYSISFTANTTTLTLE